MRFFRASRRRHCLISNQKEEGTSGRKRRGRILLAAAGSGSTPAMNIENAGNMPGHRSWPCKDISTINKIYNKHMPELNVSLRKTMSIRHRKRSTNELLSKRFLWRLFFPETHETSGKLTTRQELLFYMFNKTSRNDKVIYDGLLSLWIHNIIIYRSKEKSFV